MEQLKSQEVSGRRRSEGERPEFQVRAMYEVREEARVRQSIDESEKHWRGDRGGEEGRERGKGEGRERRKEGEREGEREDCWCSCLFCLIQTSTHETVPFLLR